MKGKAVSALRSKRGLRPMIEAAEPPVVGLTPQTTVMTERTDTMKTYLLRETKSVEPQSARRAARTRPATATVREVLGPAAQTKNGPVLFIGLDVPTDSIAVSLAAGDGSEVRRYGIIGGPSLPSCEGTTLREANSPALGNQRVAGLGSLN